jgi:hypothetical protein
VSLGYPVCISVSKVVFWVDVSKAGMKLFKAVFKMKIEPVDAPSLVSVSVVPFFQGCFWIDL